MHLELQSIINYITIGILVIFLSITIFSILTNKLVALRKKKEEERIQKLPPPPQQFYKSSKVYTFSVPENSSSQHPTKKTIEQKSKHAERFQVINDSTKQNTSTFSYRSWN